METATVIETNQKTEENSNESLFERAESFPLFDENQNELSKFRGIRNVDNKSHVYCTVTKSYKLVQHQEIYETLLEALDALDLENKVSWEKIGEDGARYRWSTRFPNVSIKLGLAGELIDCAISIDNSYDKTTGLRNNVNGIYSGLRIPTNTNFGSYYSRHTNGLSVEEMKNTISKSVAGFQEEVEKKWERYYNTKLNNTEVIETLEGLLDKKKTPAKKYLVEFIKYSKKNNYKNFWEFYTMVCEVLTVSKASVDVYDNVAKYMDSWLQRNYKKFALEV